MLPSWLPPLVLRETQAPSIHAVHGELLRQWTSSEVWRLSYGLRSVIAKRGTDTQAGEGAAYERFVVPLGLPAPKLLYAVGDVLVLEDVGRVTLEQEPTAEGFAAAARLLASIRTAPATGPSGFPPARVKELGAWIGRITFDLSPLTEALTILHRQAPARVVHGDFVPKNLVTDGMRWTAVD